MAGVIRRRVLIVDPHPLTRLGIAAVVRSLGLQVAREVASAGDALPAAMAIEPDLVVLETRLERDGAEVVRDLVRARPGCPLLAFSSEDAPGRVADVLRAGAAGYVVKTATADVLMAAVRKVLAGERHVCPEATRALAAAARLRPPSEREQQVLALIAQGYQQREIAARLGIGVRTVQTHRENLKLKLGIERTADLVRFAVSGVPPRARREDQPNRAAALRQSTRSRASRGKASDRRASSRSQA